MFVLRTEKMAIFYVYPPGVQMSQMS